MGYVLTYPKKQNLGLYPVIIITILCGLGLVYMAANVTIPTVTGIIESLPSVILMFLSTYDSPRAKTNLAYLASQNFSVPYYFINYTTTNTSNSLTPPESYKKLLDALVASSVLSNDELDDKEQENAVINLDLLVKFLFAMRFFLYETNAAWLWRGTDDTVVDANNFKKMRLEIQHFHNTTVFLGHCIDSTAVGSFLQGGSGILMSRKAVKRMEEFIPMKMGKSLIPDDLVIADVMKSLDVSWASASSPYFSGHEIQDLEESGMKVCPHLPDLNNNVMMPYNHCKQTLPSARDIVFYHEQLHVDNDHLTILEHWNIVRQMPPEIRTYMEQGSIHLCNISL